MRGSMKVWLRQGTSVTSPSKGWVQAGQRGGDWVARCFLRGDLKHFVLSNHRAGGSLCAFGNLLGQVTLRNLEELSATLLQPELPEPTRVVC